MVYARWSIYEIRPHLQKIKLFQSGKDIASEILNIVWFQFSAKQSCYFLSEKGDWENSISDFSMLSLTFF